MKKKFLSLLALLTLVLTFSFQSLVYAEESSSTVTPPEIVGTSAIILDVDTKEIIYSKDVDVKMQPASITKLMTALLLAENKSKSDNLTYSADALAQDPYSYGLNVHPTEPGTKFTANNAMDILLLYSGNDIAYMVAENVGGTADKFVEMMNAKALELGMTNTHFVTPNGLDDNTDDHYTTAYDLTLLLNACYNNEWVKETMAKKESEVSAVGGLSAVVENRNKLIGTEGNIGGKTGYTDKSGRCLASLFQRDGRTLAVVVLNSEYNLPEDTIVFDDSVKLANYGFAAQRQPYKEAGADMTELTLNYKVLPLIGPSKTIKVPVTLHENIDLYDSGIEPEITLNTNDVKVRSLNKNKPMGTATVTVRGYSKEYNIYPSISKGDVMKSNIVYYIIFALVLVIIASLLIMISAKIKKNKRKKYRRRY